MTRGAGWAVTHDDLLGPLQAAASRFTSLVAVLDPSEPVPGSEWTVGDTVCHVARGVDLYGRYLEGEATPAIDISDVPGGSIATSNARRLAEDPERDIPALTAALTSRLAEVCTLARARPLDEVVSWHGRPEALRVALASMLAEVLIHGRDLAAVRRTRWEISEPDAVAIAANIAPLFPLLVNPETTRSLDAVIRVRVRRGPQLDLAFRHGTLDVGATGRRPDATVSADAVAFLLVAYGRAGKWPAIARGKLVAWGRRPWLALRLTSYLVQP